MSLTKRGIKRRATKRVLGQMQWSTLGALTSLFHEEVDLLLPCARGRSTNKKSTCCREPVDFAPTDDSEKQGKKATLGR